MDCFFCEEKGIRESFIKPMDKAVPLCNEHYRIFGDTKEIENGNRATGPPQMDN